MGHLNIKKKKTNQKPNNHILGQDILLIAIPIVNDFESIKISSNFLTVS